MDSGELSDDGLKVLLADDHGMILEMIDMYLSRVPDIHLTTAKTLDKALEHIEAGESFDIVVLDLNMPGMGGSAGVTKVKKRLPDCPVAILTGEVSSQGVRDLIDVGTDGIVLKTTPLKTLVNAIRFMAEGEQFFPKELMLEIVPSETAKTDTLLSPKEQLVLSYLAEGMSNRQIASRLSLAEPTIKMHVRSVCVKLRCKNRTQAVIAAQSQGLV